MKEKEIQLKIIVRGLPPFLTEEDFNETVNPLPLHNYFRFVPADTTLGPNANGRCYIKFLQPEELFKFMERYNRYVFIDSKGHESMAFVEYAPFQKVPKSSGKKADPKAGSLKEDPDFKKFEESQEAGGDVDKAQTNSIETYLEEIKSREKEVDSHRNGPKVITPLIEYVRQKREERRAFAENKKEDRRRYEERRRAIEDDKRRMKEAREQERREQKQNKAISKSKQREDEDQGEEVSVRVCENPERRKSKIGVKTGGGGGGSGVSGAGSRSRNSSYRGGSFEEANSSQVGQASCGGAVSVRRSGHRPESYFESRSRNKNARSTSGSTSGSAMTGLGDSGGAAEAKKDSARSSDAVSDAGSTTRREKGHGGIDKSEEKEKSEGGRSKPRRADRPIYNPAERIAERQRQKKQQQQKDQGKSKDKT